MSTTVRTTERATLDWLAECLSPGYRVGADAVMTPRSRHVVVELHDDVLAPELSARRRFAVFAHERGLVALPGREQDGWIEVQEPTFEVRIAVKPGHVLLRRTGPRWRRGALLSVINAITLTRLLGLGGHLQLHASALKVDGQAMAFVGAKWSGKTTTMARLASSLRAPMIANDRVVVASRDHHLTVTGVPTMTSVRPGTLARLATAFADAPVTSVCASMTAAEYERARVAAPEPDRPRPDALTVSPPQLARQLDTTLSTGAPLGWLVLVRVDPDVQPFALTPLASHDGADALRAFSFEPSRDPSRRTIFERAFADGPPPAAPRIAPGRLSAVRTVALTVGPALLSDPDAPARLMRALTDDAAG